MMQFQALKQLRVHGLETVSPNLLSQTELKNG